MICPSAAVAYTFNKQSKQVWEDFEKGGNSGKHLRKFGGNSLQGGVFFQRELEYFVQYNYGQGSNPFPSVCFQGKPN